MSGYPRSDPSRPEISQFAAARMGADPADCIVIEDSSFGIQGAVAARLTAAGADFVCADWQEISRQLSELGVPV